MSLKGQSPWPRHCQRGGEKQPAQQLRDVPSYPSSNIAGLTDAEGGPEASHWLPVTNLFCILHSCSSPEPP